MSTQKKPLLSLTIMAAAVIAQYSAVTLTGAVAAAGSEGVVFATSDAEIGENFTADAIGTTTALAGEAISAGDALEVGTGGKLVVQTTGARVAYALYDAGVDTPFEVLIDKAPAAA